MDSEDKIHDYLEVTSKCDHDVLLKNEQELKPIYLPMSLLKAITKNFSDGLQIGSGGFAVVYKGLLKRGGTVAVKKLLNTICMDDNQFQKEVSCLMMARHKNIVRFLGYCADTQGKMEDYKGKFVLADERERLLCFEYLPNGSLEKYINDASGGLEWNKRYIIIKGICEGLQYLHENNIVHLDVKPANILLNVNMVPKISDFGQSRCFEEMQSRIVTSTLIGSIGYLAPEFFSGEITKKLDIYSLGVVIAEMLTGQKGYSPVENVLECWRKRFGESYPDTYKLLEQVRVCAKIRVSCGNLDPTKRPDIQQITAILNSDEFPKRPSVMVRKKRTGPGESSGEASGAPGQGSSQRPQTMQQGARGGGQHQGRSGYQGRGAPPSQHPGGGPPEPQPRAYQGHGGYQGRGGPPSQHPGGGPPPGSQPRDYQGRGGPRPRGGMPQPYRGGHVGGSVGPSVPSGPSRSVPDLHQAIQHQAPVVATPSPQGADSSSQPGKAEVSTGQVQQLAIRDQSSASQAGQVAPASSKAVRFPLRPGKGTHGSRCIVKANHFFAELPNKDLHQYDVSITPEVTSRGVNRAVMGELVNLYRHSHLDGRLPAYDGRKSLYTAGALPFTSKTFEITLQDEEDSLGGGQRRQRVFRVVIKFAARADLHHLAMFLAGRQPDAPQEALQVLEIVLRELPTAKYCPVGRSFYSPNLGRCQHLGDGLETWRGFYRSIRPTQMGLSLNIDMSSTAFIEPLPVIEFVAQLLNRDISVRPLSDSDRVKIKKALRGVKVEVTHRGNMRRKYRISGLTSQATRELSFPIDDRGTVKTVVQYFLETYGFSIQHTTLPCLQVGNQQRPNYLPMEVCKIVEGQHCSKRLNEKQITALVKVTCQRPHEREKDILQTVHHNAYSEDPYAQEFGIRIDERLASVEARVLPPPKLKYHDSGRERDVWPRVGQWNMMNKKMVNGGRVSSWACINFSRNVQDGAARSFCHDLALMCQVSGMDFALEPVLPHGYARPEHVEKALKGRYQDAMNILRPQGRELDLLIVILPDNNGSLYGDLKRICETDLGLVSQCCLTKHVFKANKQQYLANVALKINVKVGGRNTLLADALTRRIPLVSDVPTIIFGADVTHPHPGEDSSPSIAAVVASQDWPEVTKYAGLVSAQAHRQELIQDLFKVYQDPQRGGSVSGGMVRELLISFWRATGQKPKRIIFYRDGVSEGQFYQVLLYELDAIRRACASLESDYQPPVTFVVVQKRHHTRLFANNHNDPRAVDKSGNILPGTVVDSKICHPTEFDFYLCSHAGIQGTSRPAHYHVLWDENKFTADGLQTLTNNLCYTYARCTRSVSIVPPAYYAHLAAFRARFYMEPDTTDSGSMASGATPSRGPPPEARNTRAGVGNVAVRPLPALKENVKRVMFYC